MAEVMTAPEQVGSGRTPRAGVLRLGSNAALVAVVVGGLLLALLLATRHAATAYPVKVESAKKVVSGTTIALQAVVRNRTGQPRCLDLRAVARSSDTKDVGEEVPVTFENGNRLAPHSQRGVSIQLTGYTTKQIQEEIASAVIYVYAQHTCR